MAKKFTYEEFEQRTKELEKETIGRHQGVRRIKHQLEFLK